jgi:hypothetical protein
MVHSATRVGVKFMKLSGHWRGMLAVMIGLALSVTAMVGVAPTARADDGDWVLAAADLFTSKDVSQADQAATVQAGLNSLISQAGNDPRALFNIMLGVDRGLGGQLYQNMGEAAWRDPAKAIYRATEQSAADVFFDGSCYHGVVTDDCWKTVGGVYSWEIRSLGNDAALVKINGFGFLWTRPGSVAYSTDDYTLGYKRFAWSMNPNDALVEPGSSATMASPDWQRLPATIRPGQTIRVNPVFSPAPWRIMYQWWTCYGTSRVRSIITDSPSYTAQESDVGCTVSAFITGSRAGYAPGLATAYGPTGEGVRIVSGDPTDPSAKPFKTALPKISGAAKVGKTLKAASNAKKWSPRPSSVAYQWMRDGAAISGATKYSYKLVAADYRAKITVKVTGSKSGYTSATRTSKATKAVKAGTMSKGKVKIVGSRKVGNTLTAQTWKWSSGTTFGYQWYRGKARILGATTKTYTLAVADHSKKIKVKVTAIKTGYLKRSVTSKAAKIS